MISHYLFRNDQLIFFSQSTHYNTIGYLNTFTQTVRFFAYFLNLVVIIVFL